MIRKLLMLFKKKKEEDDSLEKQCTATLNCLPPLYEGKNKRYLESILSDKYKKQ